MIRLMGAIDRLRISCIVNRSPSILQVSPVRIVKMSDAHLSQLTFDSLPIGEPLKRAIAELGYTRCTPIQAQTLPVALAGRDVAGQAQTGTGKTAAFLIALFNRLAQDSGAANRPRNAPRAIVIAPTR